MNKNTRAVKSPGFAGMLKSRSLPEDVSAVGINLDKGYRRVRKSHSLRSRARPTCRYICMTPGD